MTEPGPPGPERNPIPERRRWRDRPPAERRVRHSTELRDLVALVLAVSIGIAVWTITLAVLYDAIVSPDQAGLSDNATQVLVAAFGGIIGVLGTFIGFRVGRSSGNSNGGSEPE